jgi:biotin carboxyl carrier protein
MKMENELRSTGAGAVREIRVKEGDAVVGGHPLVVIE